MKTMCIQEYEKYKLNRLRMHHLRLTLVNMTLLVCDLLMRTKWFFPQFSSEFHLISYSFSSFFFHTIRRTELYYHFWRVINMYGYLLCAPFFFFILLDAQFSKKNPYQTDFSRLYYDNTVSEKKNRNTIWCIPKCFLM